jgi:hypothetical protein
MIIGSYLAVILIGIGIINWMSGGFLWPFARVKMSRGRFTLVRVRGVTGDYFRIGEIMESWLVFKDRQKEKRRLSCPEKSYINYAMGVKTIDVDDEKNAIMTADFKAVSGYDAIKFENLYVRALTAPKLEDKLMMIILIIIIIVLLVSLFNAFSIYKLGGKIDALNTVAKVAQNVV